MWTPISLAELEEWIARGESKLEGEPLNFWNLIKIAPQKWQETEYGDEGGGFWVVAIFGNTVVYYNDIEEGFNVSTYQTYGHISEYWCEQSELDCMVKLLYRRIKEEKQKTP
ncbi:MULTISPECIES: hypothetical protein [unclassified Pedobacter]|uniref:hypothetical protein n=1 Tax=unclassified Pedobacter TaxID=2628915 RepID=UPI001DA4EA9A|nr:MULTISPECIES: hypothetical protein [unclassified Pedobacter]CAH0141395.1 hypothetical protein SRABI36_00553 [Pedobacter sp. Bi36]CAH0197121.1 hypothetical protein SRABI126_01647 [Pedobacter sp. Bi126]